MMYTIAQIIKILEARKKREVTQSLDNAIGVDQAIDWLRDLQV